MFGRKALKASELIGKRAFKDPVLKRRLFSYGPVGIGFGLAAVASRRSRKDTEYKKRMRNSGTLRAAHRAGILSPIALLAVMQQNKNRLFSGKTALVDPELVFKISDSIPHASLAAAGILGTSLIANRNREKKFKDLKAADKIALVGSGALGAHALGRAAVRLLRSYKSPKYVYYGGGAALGALAARKLWRTRNGRKNAASKRLGKE